MKPENKTPPKCQCGRVAKYVKFTSFEYWYCDYCKKEVDAEKEDKKKDPGYPWGFQGTNSTGIPLPSDSDDDPWPSGFIDASFLPPPDTLVVDKPKRTLDELVKLKAKVDKCYRAQ
jgi:hypothetical protein